MYTPVRSPLSRHWSARRILLTILVAGLVVRAVLVWGVTQVDVHTDDERDYLALAQSIDEGRGFAYSTGPTSMRPPLYPAFVASVWRATGIRSLTAVRVSQIGLSLITVLLVYLLAAEMFDRRTGLIAAAIWSFYPSFLYANVLLLTEVLFTLFVLAACVAVSRLIRPASRHHALWALAAGGCVGLAALTRSVLYPFPLVLLPLLAWLTAGSWQHRLRVSVCAGLAYLALVGPWSYRNTQLQQTFVVVDTMGGLNLRTGNFEHTPEDRMWDGVSLKGEKAWSYAMVQEHPDASNWTDGLRDKWARDRAVEYMSQHPIVTLRRVALKFADFWGLEREYIAAVRAGKYPIPAWFEIGSSAAVIVAYITTMILACVGAFLVTRRNWKQHVAPLAVVAWVCGIHAIVFGHSRYHLPLMPIVIAYAAAAAQGR